MKYPQQITFFKNKKRAQYVIFFTAKVDVFYPRGASPHQNPAASGPSNYFYTVARPLRIKAPGISPFG